MNVKQIKKLRKLYKKDLREKMLAQISILDGVLKPRPSWFPRKVWSFLTGLFLDIEKLRKILGQ